MTLRFILGDQLSTSISSLSDLEGNDIILMAEVMEEATYVPHHPKKIAFLFSAMRHFAQKLLTEGFRVQYITLEDPHNTGSLTEELSRAIEGFNPSRIVVTEPGEYRVLSLMKGWSQRFGLPVEIRSDDRFLATHKEFDEWGKGKSQLRMEYFYREMRKKYSILIEKDGTPIGGRWNFDKENRKPPPKTLKVPKRLSHKKSPIVQEVLALVRRRFGHHFGNLEPFHYAVTAEQANLELEQFLNEILPFFGDYQDAMVAGEPYLFHSLLSSYLNAGLLLPLDVCRKAEAAYQAGKAPLNAVEGFIRQILGWREFIRGVYWLHMPHYGEQNYLQATRPLPAFFWGAPTNMFCVAEVVRHTQEHAYSHHIQRLMITGNFALLAGLEVKAIQEWYLAVYSDAYEWVEMPNTLGMALYGDGGLVASKPYAASGNYIQRMSNFCSHCSYNPNEVLGEQACPFNALYWDFLARHETRFRANQRMRYMYTIWDKFSGEKQNAIRAQARKVLQRMTIGNL